MSEFGKTSSPVNFQIALWSLSSEVKTFTTDFSEQQEMATNDFLLLSVKLNEVMLASKWIKLHGFWLSVCLRGYLFLCEIGE